MFEEVNLEQSVKKEDKLHMNYNELMLEVLGIDKIIQLYNYSEQEYGAVSQLFNMYHSMSYDFDEDISNGFTFQQFLEQIKNVEVTDIKKVCFDFTQQQIINSNLEISKEDFPKLFISENSDLFLTNANIPNKVKERYFSRNLKVQDLLDYPEVFDNVSVDYFMEDGIYISQFVRDNYGMGKFQELVKKYPDIFAHIQQKNEFYQFNQFLKEGKDLESDFIVAVKKYFLNYDMCNQIKVEHIIYNMCNQIKDEHIIYNIPEWLSSMHFRFVERLNTVDDLLQYNDSVIVLDDKQRFTLDTLNIENIKKFEQETGFFTHKVNASSTNLEMFNFLSNYFHPHYPISLLKSEIDFKNGNLTYEEFLTQFANCLDYLRKNHVFNDYLNYNYDWIQGEFRNNHPEIFMDSNVPVSLKQAFYTNTINPDLIYSHKEYIRYLINRKLSNTLCADIKLDVPGKVDEQGHVIPNSLNFIDEYVSRYGNEKLLKLISKYGFVLSDITITSFYNEIEDEQAIEQSLRNSVYNKIKQGKFNYSYLSSVPELVSEHPELFISEDAPNELKHYFYNDGITFGLLQMHKEWLPFLKDKSIATSLLRNDFLRNSMLKFFQVFGEEQAIKLGINRSETVTEMLKSNQVDLMKSWYDKTGNKFLPDFVVMQNFNLDEADKFLVSGSNWSNLMKIKNFARTPESREAMLKLAYSFGAFDQDQRGFKKLKDLLTGLPKKIDAEQGYIFEQIDKQINQYSQREFYFGFKSSYTDADDNVHTTCEAFPVSKIEDAYQKMIDYVKNNKFNDLFDNTTLLNFLESLKKENVNIDFSKDVFSQIYRKNDDGSYTLTINEYCYPKSAQAIRSVLETFSEVPILTPEKAHKLFGGFKLKYDPNFREFLLANMDMIMKNPEYVSFIAGVQKQFSDIKVINSNRALSWDLAVSYVQTNKFTSVNVGNERVAEISAIAGYSQADFNTLQQIYNYGKQRTFSSIPRISKSVEKTSGKYTYQILRLDDPLAMAIGTLTNCCQELNSNAEVCMEHSMVDKNGRVFVIKDALGNIVAQSWVWRNKDVLCFDNIEIPDKAFVRATKEYPELGRSGFSDEVFEIYKQAAHDLIVADEKIYKELLESGKITKAQYDGLRLGKVTVGLGCNDIAESLKQNSIIDKGTISRPLPFDEPVKLSRGLYISDSTTQCILEERNDRKEFDEEAFPVHRDTYVEYCDSNFTESSLLSLEQLEIVTKKGSKNLETSVHGFTGSDHLVTEIAGIYGLNPETARIVMNPNFAIIYDVNDEKLKIGDLLFNTYVDNGLQQLDIENEVVMQIRLAFEQIAGDKEIDVSTLVENQKEMYAKVHGLTDEVDIERGVCHAR